MNEFKISLKENKWLLVLLGIVLLFLFIFGIVRIIKGNQIYQSEAMNDSTVDYIKYHYADNEYKVMQIEEVDMVERYYQMYLNATLVNEKEAWDMLSDETKNAFHDKIEEYQKELKKRITVKSKNNKVQVYRKTANGFLVIDTENYQYEIIEKGVMNVKVTLRGQVR